MNVEGSLVTTQPSLAKFEGNAEGVWIWNTWLQAYAVAGSFKIFGRSPFAARLPFALAGLLCLMLLPHLFDKDKRSSAAEGGQMLLALTPAFLLFARQARYYSLSALGTVLILLSWKMVRERKKHAVLCLVLSLQFMLHTSLAFFVVAVAVLAADSLFHGREFKRSDLAAAAALSSLLSVPAFWYFRVWDRPGNHMYSFGESFEFLKTFVMWISLFAVPALLPAAVQLKRRRYPPLLAGVILFSGLATEGMFSRVCAALTLIWLIAIAVREKRDAVRLAGLWLAASLAVLSVTAAEPYGRYLMGALPVCAILAGTWISELANGKRTPAYVMALALAGVTFGGFFPRSEPAPTVSGMMRQRLRDVRPRSDLARFLGELARGPRGYIEPAAEAIKAGGGGTVFSDSDQLSLMFAAGVRPVYKDELASVKPDWLLLSPWLRLDGQALLAVSALAAEYEPVPVTGPVLLWQNNPDPLFRDFAPKRGPLPLLRRRVSLPRRPG
ncbi:MAG: glycosyltransferase family 39 protein [Elusimicrobia bacterium]|nr:glycosyltransferase family 39 protein [Elusimicrobiota bacterium]